jgi:hypothetical protein
MSAEYKNDPNPILLDSTINEHIDLLLYNIFCYRRRFVTGYVLLQETFCYMDTDTNRDMDVDVGKFLQLNFRGFIICT